MAVILAILLMLRILVAKDPLAGISAPLGIAAAALCLFCTWTLVSSFWSQASARALIESDRTLAYVLALILFGSFARTAPRLRWLVRGLAAAVVVVCVAGFVSRTVPELWSVPLSPVAPDRLGYPLTYWNALGAVAGLGMILCFYLASSSREAASVRVLAAAALPIVAATLLLTFSRGAIAACVLGLVCYVVLARPDALLGGLLASGPFVAVAVIGVYRADDVASGLPTDAALEQGHDLALLILGCVVLAAVLRALLLRLDRFAPLLPQGRTPALATGAATIVAVGLGIALTAGGIGFVDRQYERFVQGGVQDEQVRDRLTQVGNAGRIAHWDAALEGFRREELHGQGAGTYPILWARYRPSEFNTTEGHSLYLETLGELGLVGLALLAAALVALFVGVATRVRGPDRAVYAALLGALVAWAFQAGIDWLWEMPAATMWVFCAGGAALAAGDSHVRSRAPVGRRTRVILALGVLLVALTPGALAISQWRLNDSIRAFERGDCPAAVDAALGSTSAVSVRPEPYEILGYCNARAGLRGPAVQAFRAAIRRDPRNWELHYGLAVVRASGGLDPRPEARTALRLNPLDERAAAAVESFSTDSMTAWRRRARVAPLLLP